MRFDLVGPGYYGVSDNLNINRCINFIPVIDAVDGKNTSGLMGVPGLELRINVGTDIIRGMHVFNGRIYFVAGEKLYSWTPGESSISSQLGDDLNTSIGRISMADNGLSPAGGNQLVIADGSQLYVWNVDTEAMTLVEVAAETVCFIGGYFMANIGGAQFQTSALYDGTSWNDLDKATAEAAPDDLLAVHNHHGEAWLLGQDTIEIWYQIAEGNPPFNRMSGGVIDFGCVAAHTVAQGNNSLIWLGTKRNNSQGEFIGVCMATGYNVEIISPPAINNLIQSSGSFEDAFAYCYTDRGHEYYLLTVPSSNITLVYDTTTKLWHERSSYQDDPYKIRRHRSNCYAYLNGRHYVGDFENGNIYEMSSDYLTEADDPIVSMRVMPHLADKEELNNVFYHEFELDLEQGTQDIVTTSYDGYSIYTTNDTSSTTVTMYINGDEVFSTYLSEADVMFVNPLPLMLMVGVNGGLDNWPTDSAYWGSANGWPDNVTENANGTVTVALQSHNYTFTPYSDSNLYAVMDPQDGITNPANLSLPQYPDIKARTSEANKSFTLTLDNPYADNVSSEPYVIERNPQAILSWSDDGGKTWSNDHFADMGKQGEYRNRVIWRRLGRARNRVFRIVIADAVKKMLIGAHIKFTKGNS